MSLAKALVSPLRGQKATSAGERTRSALPGQSGPRVADCDRGDAASVSGSLTMWVMGPTASTTFIAAVVVLMLVLTA